MTPYEAIRLLDSIGYDPSWTTDQLRAAVADLSADVRDKVPEALRITAALDRAEADWMERTGLEGR